MNTLNLGEGYQEVSLKHIIPLHCGELFSPWHTSPCFHKIFTIQSQEKQLGKSHGCLNLILQRLIIQVNIIEDKCLKFLESKITHKGSFR